MTRKLTIRTKLAATLAIPLVALATFAALQVRGAYREVDRVKAQAGLATAATGPSGLLGALETERDYSALWEIGSEDLVDKQSAGDVTSVTNVRLSDFRQKLQQLGVFDSYSATLSDVSTQLASFRSDAQRHSAKSASAGTAKQANVVFDDYTKLVNKLLDVDERTSQSIADAQLRTGAELLNAIARQDDIERQIALKAVLARSVHSEATAFEVQQLAASREAGEQRLADVFSTGDYQHAIQPTLTSPERTKVIVPRLRQIVRDPLHVTPSVVFATVADGAVLWRNAQQVTADDFMHERAQHLTSAAQDEERNWIVVTIASVLLAIVMLRLAHRWITRPLRSLAAQAGTLAGERLPDAVQQILDAPTSEAVVPPDVEPVLVRAGGEVAEVAAALNRVQDSAIHLAVEQAQLRGNVADAFVNLGRRNQNLLSRQLEFITQLENDESDPETLEHLFRLDHLATRMRRNAESLLVLAGHEPPRTWSAPVEIGDVVRGALGEVEGYRRVRLRHLDDARVDGTAAVDVSHVIAELVENALAFSPPDTDVEVYGRRDDYGYVLTIVDQGIGMTADDLRRANALISSANALTFAPSRFLGHYVVAQLAARHALGVDLSASPAGGLTAMISVPPELLGEGAVVAPVPEAATFVEPPFVTPAEAVPALPRRAAPLADPPAPAVEAATEAEPEPEPEPVRELEPWHELERPEPEPAPRVAPAVELGPESEREVDGAPEPTLTVTPEPPTPTRPRLGIGTFADLRATPTRGAPRAEPAPVADVPPAPEPSEPPVTPAPDRAAAFADVANAVDAVTAPVSNVPSAVFSEDLLPQKLPKRGRRSSRLGAPWARDKKASSVAAPPAAVSAPAPASPPMPPSPAPTRDEVPSAHGSLHFPPGGPALASAGASDPEPEQSPARSAAEGDNRFAFFAAFRAAAERAREEAGIDDRRVGP